jgi:hypothetical protein
MTKRENGQADTNCISTVSKGTSVLKHCQQLTSALFIPHDTEIHDINERQRSKKLFKHLRFRNNRTTIPLHMKQRDNGTPWCSETVAVTKENVSGLKYQEFFNSGRQFH